MSGGLVTAAYIVAAILFIFSLAGLSKHETSRQGNNFGIAGMAIALLATIFGPDTGNVCLLYTSPSPRDRTMTPVWRRCW